VRCERGFVYVVCPAGSPHPLSRLVREVGVRYVGFDVHRDFAMLEGGVFVAGGRVDTTPKRWRYSPRA
jgi:hypothetical protein